MTYSRFGTLGLGAVGAGTMTPDAILANPWADIGGTFPESASRANRLQEARTALARVAGDSPDPYWWAPFLAWSDELMDSGTRLYSVPLGLELLAQKDPDIRAHVHELDPSWVPTSPGSAYVPEAGAFVEPTDARTVANVQEVENVDVVARAADQAAEAAAYMEQKRAAEAAARAAAEAAARAAAEAAARAAEEKAARAAAAGSETGAPAPPSSWVTWAIGGVAAFLLFRRGSR